MSQAIRRPAPRRRRNSDPSLDGATASRARLTLDGMFETLKNALGPQGWWPVSRDAATPAQARLEIVLGAVLTQNTAWENVRRALAALYRARLVDLAALDAINEPHLAEIIRSSGTFRVKARRIKAFVRSVQREFAGSLEALLGLPLPQARAALLRIHGVGPETADAILLYAGRHATFVIDAYTRRVLVRHQLATRRDGYDDLQARFHEKVPANLDVYHEYHALIVELSKRHCRAKARCEGCPLEGFPHDPSA